MLCTLVYSTGPDSLITFEFIDIYIYLYIANINQNKVINQSIDLATPANLHLLPSPGSQEY